MISMMNKLLFGIGGLLIIIVYEILGDKYLQLNIKGI